MDRSECRSRAWFQRILEIEPMVAKRQSDKLGAGHHPISEACPFQILACSLDADSEDHANFPIALPGRNQAQALHFAPAEVRARRCSRQAGESPCCSKCQSTDAASANQAVARQFGSQGSCKGAGARRFTRDVHWHGKTLANTVVPTPFEDMQMSATERKQVVKVRPFEAECRP